MRIAILSDIHSNFHALKSVSRKIKELSCSSVWVLGDIVGYGAFPNECVKWVRENASVAVLGNHELAVLGLIDPYTFNPYAAESLIWTKERLNRENRDYLASLSIQAITDCCHLVHDSPANPGTASYILTKRDAYLNLLKQQKELAFFGHTHIPAAYRLWGPEVDVLSPFKVYLRSGRYLINPGSVGQPRDGNPKASFGVLDLKEKTFTLYRVEYNLKAAAREILRAGLPKIFAARIIMGE
ncbi:metallophosphoesterase family protein [Thermovibrio sp.]